jgi:two-component system cell cycle response regulator DivK
MRLLVVDDVKQNSELISSAVADLCEDGILVSERATEAIETAISYQPNLIFMDLQLPDFSGCKAIKLLRTNASTAHIPIIAISAHALKKYEQEALEAGSDMFLSKPVSIVGLRNLVQKYQSKLKKENPVECLV